MLAKQAVAALKLMPETLRRHVAGITDAELHYQPEDGYFSVLENICHLRDIEIEGYNVRLKRILAEERPNLADINGDQLARERHYNQQPLAPALDAFTKARHANLEILGKETESRLSQTTYPKTAGKITLDKLLEL